MAVGRERQGLGPGRRLSPPPRREAARGAAVAGSEILRRRSSPSCPCSTRTSLQGETTRGAASVRSLELGTCLSCSNPHVARLLPCARGLRPTGLSSLAARCVRGRPPRTAFAAPRGGGGRDLGLPITEPGHFKSHFCPASLSPVNWR